MSGAIGIAIPHFGGASGGNTSTPFRALREPHNPFTRCAHTPHLIHCAQCWVSAPRWMGCTGPNSCKGSGKDIILHGRAIQKPLMHSGILPSN